MLGLAYLIQSYGLTTEKPGPRYDKVARSWMLSRPVVDRRSCIATQLSISVALSEVMRGANWRKFAELRSYPRSI